MFSGKFGSRGFTLIASLLLLVLLSGFALGLLMMVNTEQRVGGNDLNNNYAYHATEGAIEKMSSDLGNTFKNIQAPTASQICSLSSNYPTWDPTVSYPLYNVAPVSGCTAPLTTVWGPISAGPDQGLYAQIIPVTMNASAQRLTGETVSMTRTAEVALIPVFQFGVFSDSDLFFGRSPDLGFAGRVHTNGDLYLGVSDNNNLVFGDKISAFGNVIRAVMDNNVPSPGNNNGGTVMIPTSSTGCSAQMANVSGANPSPTCIDISTTALGATDGSVTGGHGSAQNTANWQNVSWGTLNSYLIDGNGQANGQPGTNNTGATNLTLPFVTGALHPFEIIRRPPVGESVTSVLGSSRLANEAQIRVLLSDKEADLHLPDWNGDATKDIELVSLAPEMAATNKVTIAGHDYFYGESACGNNPVPTVGGPCLQGDTRFVMPPSVMTGTGATTVATQAEWPLINGWLLVEVKWSSDSAWHGVTDEWLNLGFARGFSVPTAPRTNNLTTSAGAAVTDMKDAILYLQTQADRTGNGSFDATDAISFRQVSTNTVVTTPATPYGANSQYSWYPINFYDAREGEVYDNRTATFPYSGTATCTANGIMNAVEIDVGNLKNWLAGTTGATGNKVDYTAQNGYILYFSDRRGMQYDPTHSPLALTGAYGFEDTVNYVNAAANFATNGALEPANYNGVSPENVEMWSDGTLSTYGVKTVGDAFGTLYSNDTNTRVPKSPYVDRFACYTVGRVNRVTGARHVLKLVDGSLGNLPVKPAASGCTMTVANPTGCGGFTVGAENPVYIQGNYNSNCPAAGGGAPCTPGNTTYDPTWTSTTANEPPHAAAAVIADAVTLLSNNWVDAGVAGATTNGSLVNPVNTSSGQNVPATQPNRIAVTSHYRVAIAAGKTIAFSNTAQNPEFGFGSDGGIHNFLRFLEDWGGIAAQQNLYYKGSIVSLYWNTYATGTFKCCDLVYNPPNRQYTFDSLFSIPQNLPPGTPMFRNVDNLSYRQNQVARTN